MAIRLKVQDNDLKLKVGETSSVKLKATEVIGSTAEEYTGEYTVTPSTSQQTLHTDGLLMTDDVTVNPIPQEYIVPSGTVNITENGTVNVRQYASANVNVEPNLQKKSVIYTPSTKPIEDTVTPDKYDGLSEVNVTVEAMPGGSATTPATTITANPTISVNGSGLITASVSASQDITPTVQEGYVDRGTAGRVNVSGSGTSQLSTLPATTYTPTKASSIVIPSGNYLTGDQTVNPIPEAYYDMSGEWAFLGKDATIIKTDFYSKVDYLKNTSWHGWTPSTTAQTCVASVNCSTFTATNVADYDYFILWECGVDPVYNSGTTNKALPQLARAWLCQNIVKRPSTFAYIQASNFNNTVSINPYNSSFLRYYGTTTGTSTFTWGASYGFYFANTSAGISSATAASPTITPKTPTLSARCNATYMSTANAALVDEDNTKWWIKGKYVIRCKKTSFYQGFYEKTVALINAASPTA